MNINSYLKKIHVGVITYNMNNNNYDIFNLDDEEFPENINNMSKLRKKLFLYDANELNCGQYNYKYICKNINIESDIFGITTITAEQVPAIYFDKYIKSTNNYMYMEDCLNKYPELGIDGVTIKEVSNFNIFSQKTKKFTIPKFTQNWITEGFILNDYKDEYPDIYVEGKINFRIR